ncbi:hypothetical protein ACJRO7_020166 [Eucalyptus globulus]|uniref:NB-ARC domain-containing protein n=1 Tax=Eucalyptus globulus TaxID=34317 RepID=A0ABD3KFS9_EUCGL
MGEAFATSVVSNLVSKLGEYLIAPIGHQFGYVLCYKSYVEDLQKGVRELETAWERVQHSVQEAENNGKLIENDIKDWLESVKEEIEKADKLLRRGESAKDACFHGWFPNPVVRHPIGRKVKKITTVIKGLHEKSQNNNFLKVYYDNHPIGIVTATTSAARLVDNGEDVLGSRAKTTEEVMRAIVDDKVCVIGVWGAGGVGKSKLLEDIERRVKKEKLFDVVVMANISRNPNLERIQKEIAFALGLTLMNEETARGRACLLCERLKKDPKKKILIILDNLWKKQELKEVGIPCGDDNKIKGCKLLISSRYRDVLRIDMGSDQEVLVNELEDGEARRLFERIVGDRVKDHEFESLVDGVVKNCGGLPLLILSVAKRLKHGDLAVWRNALTTLERSDIKAIVEDNYKDLKGERMRSLFMFCALTSGKIFRSDSLFYCMGLGLFKKYTIAKARDRLMMDLHSLQDSSLLLDSDNRHVFRMHDIFVDEATSIASTELNVLVGRKGSGFKEWSENELKKCIAISFCFVGIDELPDKLDCPNLRMFLLCENNSSLKISESLFESMEKLQVLHIVGFSFTSLPSSIKFLEDLTCLRLVGCHLEDVIVLGKLKRLQFLLIYGSTITRLPKEIGELTELRLLDLRLCPKLKVIEPGVLKSLVNLEELCMEYSFDQWEANDEAPRSNANLAELKNMKKLSTLSIAIPHSANLPKDLPFGNLYEYKIQIGDVWNWSHEYNESRTLTLKLDSGDLLHEEWVERCFRRTQVLHLDGLQDGNNSIHDLCADGFLELKHLHVRNSPSFQYVVHSPENVQCTAFMKLESLLLKNLNYLEKICLGCLAPESFGKLKIVKVENCGAIKHLFPLSMTRIFLQLEEIEINECHLMQQIVSSVEADDIDGDEIHGDWEGKSCSLRRLTLRYLPEMTSFCKDVDPSVDFFDGQQLIKLQSLETITIEGCPLIQEVFGLEGLTASGEVEILSQLRELILSDLPSLQCIWNKNPRRVLCFQNLRALMVQNCENLRFLFSPSMAKALVQINEIRIASCKLMEEIVDIQEEELEEAATTDTLDFPLLTSLSLEELPNLKTFSSGKYRIHCPSLIGLTISKCPKMMTFSSFDGRQQSMIDNVGLQQALDHFNSSLSLLGFFNEKVLFPNLEELKLSSMCQLQRIWHNQLQGQSFCKLASLTVEFCENLSHVFPSNSIDWLQSLNKIEVVGCPSLEALFESISLTSVERPKKLVLYALKKLKLLNLPRLRDILKSNCKVTLVFPNLMEVNVRRCHTLSHLFSSDMAKTLDKLVVLDVSYCNNLRGIIAMEEGKEKTIETFKFRHLSTLKLGDLENLICFSSESCAGDGLCPLFDEKLAFPKLQELQVKGVQQKELWNDKFLVEAFCRLKILKVKQCLNLMTMFPSFMWKRLLHCMESLTIEKCPCLRNLFTMSMVKSLGQLQHLGIYGCEEMEYIIAREEGKLEEEVDRIVIPQLVTLYLHNMPKLKSFCQGKHISKWPSLKKFTIEDCKAVEVILEDANCSKLEDNVLTQRPLLLVEKVEFPDMESLKISHMDNMEKIWLDNLPSNAFSKLKTLVVEYCKKLSSIFSSYTMLTRFQNLEEITVTNCGSLEVVFHVQEFNFSESHSTSIFQLRKLVLTRLPRMKHVWSGHNEGSLTFGCLRCTEVVECKSIKSLFPSSVAKSMTQLEKLVVRDCGVEEIITEEDRVGMNASDLFFPQLIYLSLLRLPELRNFYKKSHASTWPFLKELRVRHCSKMRLFSFDCEFQSCQGTTIAENQPAFFSFKKVIPHLDLLTLTKEDVVMMQHYIFGNLKKPILGCYHDQNATFPSNFLLHRFPNLEILTVFCSSFEEIFPEDAFGHGGTTPYGGLTEGGKALKALGNLKRLWLQRLYNMRRVWKDGSLMAEILKQIEFLFIWQCPSLLIVLPSPTSFQNLMTLEVYDCPRLVHLGTCLAVISLGNLICLILRDCGAMEDVVADDGNGVEEISFHELKELTLDGLLSLESFSPTNCAFRFPSLVRIVVKQCPKMNIFCKGALRTPELDRVLLSLQDDEGTWEGDLNTTIQTLST